MSTMSYLLSTGSFPKAAGPVNYAVNSCAYVKTLPEIDQLKVLLKEKLLVYHRFRSVPQGRFWKQVEVNIDDHIHIKDVISDVEIKRELEKLVNTLIPTSRPRWECYLLRNTSIHSIPDAQLCDADPCFKASGPFHVIVIRVDHCIADGISLVEVFSKVMTDLDGKPIDSKELVGLKRAPTRKRTIGAFFAKRQFSFYSKVSRWVRIIKVGWRIFCGIPKTLAMGFGSYDSETSFTASLNEKRSGIKFCSNQKLATSGPYSLEYIKRLKTELGVSVNDVLMGAFAGGIRKYCEYMEDPNFSKKGGSVDLLDGLKGNVQTAVLCRALLPFAFLRNPNVFLDPEQALSNNWTFVSADLAVNEQTRVDRIMKTSKVTSLLKRQLQPLTNVFCNYVVNNLLPPFLAKQTLWDTFSRHSVVFANVPGPTTKLRFCGSIVEEVQILFGNTIPQAEIFTYAGRVFFNFVCDPNIISKPDKLIEFFEEDLCGLGRDLQISDFSLEYLTPKSFSRVELSHSELSSCSSTEEEKDLLEKETSKKDGTFGKAMEEDVKKK